MVCCVGVSYRANVSWPAGTLDIVTMLQSPVCRRDAVMQLVVAMQCDAVVSRVHPNIRELLVICLCPSSPEVSHCCDVPKLCYNDKQYNTSTRILTNCVCVIKPEISTKRKGTCPHLCGVIWYLHAMSVSKKHLLIFFSVTRDAWQRDMSIRLMGS